MPERPPARLTRAQAQAQTRQRLLDAARRIVLREGLSAVTVARVAADAGLTTGAVYSNFKDGRAELLLEVTRELADPLTATAPMDGGTGTWLRGVAGVLAEHTDKVGSVALATEMMGIGLRDAKVAATGAEVARESIAGLTQVIDSLESTTDTFESHELALLVTAMFAGLAQYRALLGDEEVPLELCVRAFAALAQGRTISPTKRRARA